MVRTLLSLFCLLLSVQTATALAVPVDADKIKTGTIASSTKFTTQYYLSGNKIKDTKSINIWQRQVFAIEVSINTTEEFSYLQFEDSTDRNFKLEFVKLPDTKSQKFVFTKTAILYIWPLVAGKTDYSPGKLKLMLSARAESTLILPRLHFAIRSLPEYLPPGFPVGVIALSNKASFIPRFIPRFITEHFEENYSFMLKTSGIHPDFLPDYAASLSANNITILTVDKSDRFIKPGLSGHFSYENIRTTNIPVVADHMTISGFKPLMISYFDPLKNKIDSIYLAPPLFVVTPRWLQYLLMILLIYLLILTGKKVIKRFKHIKQQRLLFSAITQSNNARQLRDSLLVFTPAKQHSQYCRDLGSWLICWQVAELASPVQLLNQLIYQQNTGENNVDNHLHLKHEISRYLKQNSPFLYWAFNR